jgi:uncharacterized repeat protein (TIGR03803 family)
VLYRFAGGSDGASPGIGSLIADKEGNLYGTTYGGGNLSCSPPFGCGTVFELSPPAEGQTAWKETVLYRFAGGSDGQNPEAGLIADDSGALYGTTEGGEYGNAGTVFKLTPPAKGQTNWTEAVLYNFCSQPGCSDGKNPYAGLIADKEGALYGTTETGGRGGNGTVFKLTPPGKGQTAWTEIVLHRFAGGSDGEGPIAGLIADNSGALYGTTLVGGTGAAGTVFKLTPPAKGQTNWTEAVLYM